MNTRILIAIALIIAAIAGWFFHKQSATPIKVDITPSEVDYEATEVKAVQTNDEGETEYELIADSLTHNPSTNQDEMSGITMDWEPSKSQRYQIEATNASINQQTGELKLSGGFTLKSSGVIEDGQVSASKGAPIIVIGETLYGNTKERKVYSDQRVKIIQGDSQFEAGSMQADLATGDYEFGKVAISFTPPERQDAKLF